MKNNIKRSKVNKSNLIQPLKYFKAKVKAMDSNYLNEYNDVVIVNTAFMVFNDPIWSSIYIAN